MNTSWISTDQTITCIIDGRTYMVSRDNAKAEKLLDALHEGHYDEVPDLLGIGATSCQDCKDIVSNDDICVSCDRCPGCCDCYCDNCGEEIDLCDCEASFTR
jgi:hypothetical protein